MSRLTAEERQRVNRTRVEAHAQRGLRAPDPDGEAPRRRPGARGAAGAVLLVVLAIVALLAWQALTFDVRGSLVETLLPRVVGEESG